MFLFIFKLKTGEANLMNQKDSNLMKTKHEVPCQDLITLRREFNDFKEEMAKRDKRIYDAFRENQQALEDIKDICTNTKITNGEQNIRIERIKDLERQAGLQGVDITSLKSNYAKLSIVFTLLSVLFAAFISLVTYGLILHG